MTQAMQARVARFGGLLGWERAAGGWEACHAGRVLRLTWLGPGQAGDCGTSPGWHLDSHPDAGPGEWPGPRVGAALPAARRLAEAWALTPPADHRPTASTPSIILVLGGSGAVFRGPSGMLLMARPDASGIIGIRASQDKARWRDPSPVGQVRPLATTRYGAVSVTWQPETPDGIPDGPERRSWQAAARVVAASAAAGDWPGGGTVISWPGPRGGQLRR
jgi:hypothetical protein